MVLICSGTKVSANKRLERMVIDSFLLTWIVFPVGLLTAKVYGPCICQRSSVKLFSNTILNYGEGYVSLYRNNALINRWYAQTNDENENIKEESSKNRIVRDGKYDIWLHDFEEIDTGVYKIVYSWEASSHTSRESTMNGTLSICIPPDADCKPCIKRIQTHGNIVYLNATLKETGCGMPPVTVYWLGINSTNGILEIKSTEDPKSYFACTTGPAMWCLMNNIPHGAYCTEEIIHKYEDMDKKNPKSDEAKKIDIIYWETMCLVIVSSTHLIIRLLYFIHGHYEKCRSQPQRHRRR